MRAYIWIFIGAVMFWMIFDQGGSILNIFADQNTDRTIGSFVPRQAGFRLSTRSASSSLRRSSRSSGCEWDDAHRRPAKFALAILLIGVSFLVMAVLGKLSADGSLVGWWWLVLVFFIQVIAELLLSPTGLSASTQLAPEVWRVRSLPCGSSQPPSATHGAGSVAGLQETLGNESYFAILGLGNCHGGNFRQIKRLRVLMVGVH